MSFALGLVVALGCGGGPKTGTWTAADHGKAERTIDKWTAADEDKYIGLTCTNVVAPDHTLRCPILVKLGFTADGCRAQLGDWRTDATSDAKRRAFRLLVAGLSSADSCEQVEATLRIVAMSIQEDTRKQATAAGCAMRDDNARDLTAERAAARRGAKDTHFADTASSAAEPIEVCGVKGELGWLTRMQCADGSRPFGDDVDRAHDARKGSMMGTGTGPCGAAPLDHYTVQCPEKSYEVYMDMYMCGPGEQLAPAL